MRFYTPNPLMTAEQVAERIVALARQSNDNVYSNIKGLLVIATPKSSVDGLLDHYYNSYIYAALRQKENYK